MERTTTSRVLPPLAAAVLVQHQRAATAAEVPSGASRMRSDGEGAAEKPRSRWSVRAAAIISRAPPHACVVTRPSSAPTAAKRSCPRDTRIPLSAPS